MNRRSILSLSLASIGTLLVPEPVNRVYSFGNTSEWVTRNGVRWLTLYPKGYEIVRDELVARLESVSGRSWMHAPVRVIPYIHKDDPVNPCVSLGSDVDGNGWPEIGNMTPNRISNWGLSYI